MSVADEVAKAMNHDPSWPPRPATEGPDARAERVRALDEFERVSGLALPEAYRYLAVEHPTFVARVRLFSDVDLPSKIPIGPFVFGGVGKVTMMLANRWTDGDFMRPLLLGDSSAGRVVDEWLPFLYPLFDSEGVVMLDFRFDPDHPPVVLIRHEAGFSDAPPRSKAVFVADDLLSLLRFDLMTEENYEDTPADPPTERALAWTLWRNTELLTQVSGGNPDENA